MSLFTELGQKSIIDNIFKGVVLVLEGLIGAGKTTLGKSLEKYFKDRGIDCEFFPEFKNDKFLNIYLADKQKHAYSFQTIMLIKRIEIYKKAFEKANRGGLAIVDRGLVGDMAFEAMQHKKGFISDEEHEAYKSLIADDKLSLPHITLFLKMNTEVAFNRMIKRGSEGEKKSYTIAYFEELQASHEEVFKDNPEIRIIQINWDEENLINNGIINEEKIRKVLNQIIRSEAGVDLSKSYD